MSENVDTNLAFEYNYILHNHLSKRNIAVVLSCTDLAAPDECGITTSSAWGRMYHNSLVGSSQQLLVASDTECYQLVNFQFTLVEARPTE